MKIRWTFGFWVLVTLMAFGSLETQAQVSGSGTAGTIPRWTGTTTLGNSSIKADANGQVAIGATPTINAKLYVLNSLGIGVKGEHTGNGTGIFGLTMNGIGVRGEASGNGRGLYGVSVGGTGVHGFSSSANGVSGSSSSGYGVKAGSSSSDGLYASTNSSDPTKTALRSVAIAGAYAGIFEGNVSVTGTLSKGGGSFKIDHPLDPENRYLFHSFVESPDMMNIYNGNIVTNENGEAVVTMPEYFEALNAEFRYQLTVIGQFAQAIVGEKIKGNRFVIRTNQPNVEVSWQVTGVRQDAFAKKHRIQVEVEKAETERGLYLHPEAFNQPVERGLEWARNPEMMKQMREQREPGKVKKQDDSDR
jgi:hypothetical protein